MLKRMEKMKMKGKMTYGYAMVIILMIIISIISIVGQNIVKGKMESYLAGAQTADTAVKVCRIQVNIAARNIREMALNDDTSTYEEYQETIQKNIEELQGSLKTLKAADVLEDELYNRYEKAITDWITIGNQIVSELNAGNNGKAVKMILEQCAPALRNAIDIAQEIDEVTDSAKEEAVRANEIAVLFNIAAIIVLLALAVIAAFFVGRKIISSIVKPLEQIEEAAVEMSRGNLHSDLEFHSEDEIGKLAHSLRSSIRTLSGYIEDIDHAMIEFSKGNFDVQPSVEWKGEFVNILNSVMLFEEKMAGTVKNIQGVANQVTNASEAVAASSNELASGASEQAGITEELTATIETVSERIRQNADNAKSISTDVQAVNSEIANSNGKMQEMVKSMNEISESSHEISKIIAAINDIATQTNLLALNASIEAARAGEAGKGFAVVADQVSVLAAQSKEAAKDSTALIESSVRAVEQGMIIADETAGQLEQVVEGSREIAAKVKKIAEASEEQAESISQISQGVENINDVVQTNSATSEECAASSQEMTGQAEMLKNLIREFKVGKFRHSVRE